MQTEKNMQEDKVCEIGYCGDGYGIEVENWLEYVCMSAQCNAERRNCFADVWMNHDSVAGTVHK